MNFLHHFLDFQPCIILDGGLATELEAYGANLKDPLWSAKILYQDEMILRKVYRDYLMAGADIIATASYQASISGFLSKGFSVEEAEALMLKSVSLAKEEINAFWDKKDNRHNRCKPLVAASIGPYGAFLADGSEYSGAYTLTVKELKSFHLERVKILAGGQPDLFAFETIPQIKEIEAICEILSEMPENFCWLSLSCKDATSLASGEPLKKLSNIVNNCPQILAIGVNCIAPEKVSDIVSTLKKITDKHLLVYPNKGEKWNAENKVWIDYHQAKHSIASYALKWYEEGVTIFGGCCRTSPADIFQLREFLISRKTN